MSRLPVILAAASALWSGVMSAQAPATGPLVTCAAVRALPHREAARGLPVAIRAVVTLTPSDAPGKLTVDDGTGIWISTTVGSPAEADVMRARLGDVVEIEGITHEGHFAPTIVAKRVRISGRGALPEPRPLAYLGPASGAHDCQRVTLTGVVQAAEHLPRTGRTELRLLVSTPTGPFTFLLYDGGPTDPTSLIDSEVSLTGVFFAYFNSRRQFIGARLFTNDPADVQIVRPPPVDAFAVQQVALPDAASFSPAGADLHRRRVRGTVTLSKPGHYFYLQEGRHALRINTRQPDVLTPGDEVEATGFFELQHHRAEMKEAVFRRLGRNAPPAPVEITRQQTLVAEPRGFDTPVQDYEDFLVALRGRLVSVDHKQGEPLRLNLECDGVLVPAELSGPADPAWVDSLRSDSALRVSGVCVMTFSDTVPVVNWPSPVSLRLLLRGPADVEVLAPASWWTPQRLWTALGLTSAVLFGTLGWVALLRRQVAHRSAQLAEAMRARRDAAVEFESTLRERNRLAADLHDTTEQALTGLAFQLEATEALHGRAPERSQQHLSLARQLLGRSREDLRRSIWNLRARPLDQHTLAEALREIAADRAMGTNARIVVHCDGTPRPLPDFVAGNLLLLAQEGITNALKHAHPGEITLQLIFRPRHLTLMIRDDGFGFDPATAEGPKDGHFGLQGMRERMKRLGGTIAFESAPGRGTTITVTVPSE
ncbi:MAG: sensor histidine kinase [Opitutaceae bacterium]|nr:sensor histidine kinase [Opitutaceae bacterium]